MDHFFNSLLTAISTQSATALNWLKRSPPDLEKARIALTAIVAAGQRADAVFNNIGALFGRTESVVEPLDMNALISNVVRTMDAEFKQHRIQIETNLYWRLPLVLGHGGQLQEVVSNLLNNAVEAIGPVSGPRVVKITTEVGSEGRVAITVEDSGRGLDPEKLQSIFEPFVTTKRRGMGLGLAICQFIIQRHEGELSARPAGLRGAIFQITLPPAEASATHRA